MLGTYNLFYESPIPALAHQFLTEPSPQRQRGTRRGLQKRTRFHRRYGYVLFHVYREVVEAYNYGFGVACISMIISMAIYMGIPLYLLSMRTVNTKQATASHAPQEELSPAETKHRITALLLVFAVVLFFGWLSIKMV